jgi:Aspartyl protease
MILRAFLAGLLLMGALPAVPTAVPTAILAAVAEARPAAVIPDSTRTIAIEVLDDGLVLVRVVVNGSGPHRFLLDTGGASTVVSDTLARQLGLIPAGSHRIDTMSGSRTVGLTRVDELRLGSETFSGVEVLWMDLANLRARDSRIQGVIGQDLLRTRSFLLDYESRRLMFDPTPDWDGDGQRLPLDWSDGRPVVRAVAHHTGRDGAGHTSAPMRFVIDSGGTHVILFDRTPARPASPRPASPWPASQAQPLVNALRRHATTTMTMRTHGGSRPVMTATVDRLELTEGIALRDVMTALVPMDPEQGRIEDGLLPASLFRAIYFDNRANEVVLNPRCALTLASKGPARKGHTIPNFPN